MQAHSDSVLEPQIASDDDSGLSDLESSPVRVQIPGSGFRRTHSTEGSQSTIRRKPLTVNTEENTAASPFISLQGLILGVSPYTYLDDARFTAFSPSARASFPSPHGEPSMRDMISMLPAAAAAMPASTPSSPRSGSHNPEAHDHHAIMKTLASLEGLPPSSVPKTQSAEEAAHMQELATVLATFKTRLPNTMLRIDLRTLNLHLALRTLEVLGCAEAMWEWVLEYQAGQVKGENGRLRSASVGSSSVTLQTSQGDQPAESTRIAIAEMTRAEFDGLLTQFNLYVLHS